MTNTQPDTDREQKLRDLLTIRSYLRNRVDDPGTEKVFAFGFAVEISRLNMAIYKIESEAEAEAEA